MSEHFVTEQLDPSVEAIIAGWETEVITPGIEAVWTAAEEGKSFGQAISKAK